MRFYFDMIDVVRILINPDYAALDINQKSSDGFTSLDEALQWNRYEIAELLREAGGEHANPTED